MSALTKVDKVNLSMIAATASAVIWMFATFASAADVNEIKLDQWYGQFYDRLDDRDEAVDEGNAKLVAEYERQMERLKAKICEADPKWERCKD
jgi:hypothetical protein